MRATTAVLITALTMGTIGLGVASAAESPTQDGVGAATKCEPGPGVTDTEIKLGSTVTTSGAGAQVAGALDGMNARITQANDTGELGKRKITLVNKDDGTDPARNLSNVQDLVEQEDVFALLNGTVSAESGASYLTQQGVPVVGWQLGLSTFATHPNFFGFQNSQTPDQANVFVDLAAQDMKAAGAKKIALISYSTINAKQNTEAAAKGIENTKGLQVAYKNTDVPPNATDFGAYVDQIKQSGADSLYVGLDTAAALGLASALKQAGVTLKNIQFTGGYDTRVLGAPGIDGVLLGIEWKPNEVMKADGSKGYQDYTKYLEQVKAGAPQNQVTASGWLAADAMITALKKTTCLTRKNLIATLNNTTNYTGNGWFAPVSYKESRGHPVRCNYYVKADAASKSFIPQFDGKQVCAATEYKNGKAIKLDAAGHVASAKS
jgi:ABC-type branched-subunit amino acid transport system substrate-binding protein